MSPEYSANYLRVKKWRKTHSRTDQNRRHYEKHKEELKEKHRQWREQHPNYYYELNKIQKNSKERYQKSRDKQLESKREYYQHHKFEASVRGQAKYYVPLGGNCELCGSYENLERHHLDYLEPLIVVTLCASCHRYIHNHIHLTT